MNLRSRQERGMLVRLGVNVDHVATVREARKTIEPDPVSAAVAAEMAGADQITIHLREDRRHIQNRDARLVREVVQTSMNLEMAATAEMQEIALALHPDSITLVPEKREEITTEGGLDLKSAGPAVSEMIETLKQAGIKTCAFVDPDLEQIKQAAHLQFDAVEIHTGQFANAAATVRKDELQKVKDAAIASSHLGMGVHAGHGINYHNVTTVLEAPEIEELNIGHAIVARALFVGLDRAVRDMLKLMGRL